MKKLDIIIIFIVVLISSIYYLNEFKKVDFNIEEDRTVEVYVNKELIFSENLSINADKKILIKSENNIYTGYEEINENTELDITGYDILYLHDNGIEVTEADCPNKIVSRMGFVRYSNMPLLCLPRGLMIVIKGNSNIKDKLPPIIIG